MRGNVKPAVAVRNEPGDDRIVTVFHFEHVTPEAFKKSQTATKASKSRGIVIED